VSSSLQIEHVQLVTSSELDHP